MPEPFSADQRPAEQDPAEQQVGEDSPAAVPLAAPQLPVVDLIGLRFSLMHLRLVGYGLLAVWLSEIANLLSSPGLGEIGSRLHYISQFLDLSPILLVAIGLIAFQGGLRRSALEQAFLPLLLCLLPLLSAFHFFLAPVSVANAVTLVQKQQQIGRDQIERIDVQIDKASSILRESDSIEALLSGLQRIPGLQVRVPPDASVAEARTQVNQSLRRERDRVRERIQANISSSRDAFLRRSIASAVLALLVGLLLWAVHRGAMREMELAVPFLDWVLVHGEVSQQPEALETLLRFQRACVALGWFAMLERLLRLARRVVRRPSAQQIAEEEEERRQQASAQPPANPFQPGGGLGSDLPRGASLPPDALWFGREEAAPDDPAADPADDALAERIERDAQARQRRDALRRRRDLERYRQQRERLVRSGADPAALFGLPPSLELDEDAADEEAELQRLAAEGDGLEPPPPPRGLARLWRWFLHHL